MLSKYNAFLHHFESSFKQGNKKFRVMDTLSPLVSVQSVRTQVVANKIIVANCQFTAQKISFPCFPQIVWGNACLF